MEVPEAVLDKLKCENCENYLSRGPILMLHGGQNRCGHCFKSDECGKRNKPYEELARLMKFPCRYKENGCEEKLRFEENEEHEQACAFRMYVCPIAESGKCEWSGLHDNLLQHCKTEHPASVIENPVKFKHDITKSSLGNYLLFAYQVLFLVQTKVSTVTKTIYHSVRLVGDPKLAAKYTYDIDISNENDKIVKRGNVARERCLATERSLLPQPNTYVLLDINALQAVLGAFKDTIFVLTVRSIDEEAEKTVSTVGNKRERINEQPTTNDNDTKRRK